MRNLLKLFVVLLTINGAFMTVQALNTNIKINAELAEILSIDVKTTSLDWDLDPAHSPLIDNSITKDKGVFVGSNSWDAWTVDVKGEKLKCAEPSPSPYMSNTLADFMTLTPGKPDTGETYPVNMGKPSTLWFSEGNKGLYSIALGFSQPVSWEDMVSKTYSTTLTFTVGHV